MSSGGARARSGPAPDPNALRRDRKDDGEWTVLPAAGRPGDPPEWPLLRATKRERDLWARLWAMPQATQWEPLGQELNVALYTRRFVEAEMRFSTVAITIAVLRVADDLGLTSAGLARNRWRIARKDERLDGPTRLGGSSRSRLTVVPGGD